MSLPERGVRMNIHVICDVAGKLFSMDGTLVSSVDNGAVEIILPNVPEQCEGAFRFRDELVPVINMKRVFGIPGDFDPVLSQIVFMQCDDGIIGFRVDRVIEITSIAESDVQSIPVIVNTGRTAYLKGAVRNKDRIVLVADHNRFLSQGELQAIRNGIKIALEN